MAYIHSVSFSFKAAVRGYHAYRASWTPEPEAVMICQVENENDFDQHAVKVCASENEITVGHLPREISRPTKYLLIRGAVVTAKLIGTEFRRSPLFQGGLEIPCMVTVSLAGHAKGNELIKKYEELVTELYIEPENIVNVGSFLKEDELDLSLPRASQVKAKGKEKAPKRTNDIRNLFNRGPPKVIRLEVVED
jgi:hypothetical protein